MAGLLIVHHTPSPAVQELLEAAVAGAGVPELDAVSVALEPPLSATASDLLAADAVLLLTPANIGYMSGAMKHFFDTVYYPCLDATVGLPYGVVVHGNNDTAGALRSVVRIAEALKWRAAVPAIEVVGAPDRAAIDAVRDAASVLGLAALGG